MKKLLTIALMAFFAISAQAQRHWTFNPYNYANTMTMVGVIHINEAEIPRTTMEIGAFCGEQCRGCEPLRYYSNVDRYLVFLSVSGETNDVISFRLYDDETEVELMAEAPTVLFTADAMLGTASNPYLFEFATVEDEVPIVAVTSDTGGSGNVEGSGSYLYGEECTLTAVADDGSWFHYWTEDDDRAVVSTNPVYTFVVTGKRNLKANFFDVPPAVSGQSFQLTQGWNWISSYVDYRPQTLAEMQSAIASECETAVIKSQDYFVSYGAEEWAGTLLSLDNAQMYLVLVNHDMPLTIAGSLSDPAAHLVILKPGWNWIGYPVNTPMPLTEALSGIQPSQFDLIKSQVSFSSYDTLQGGWTGNLQTLEPGQGYLYLSNKTENQSFVFPSAKQ